MTEADGNHCRIVRDGLSGERAVDEQTFASLAVLEERLEQLKKLDKIFSGVEISPNLKKLKKQRKAVAIS